MASEDETGVSLTFSQVAGKGIKRHGFALKYDTNRLRFD